MQRKWFSYVRIPWKMGPEKKYIKENKGRGVGMLKDFPKRWGVYRKRIPQQFNFPSLSFNFSMKNQTREKNFNSSLLLFSFNFFLAIYFPSNFLWNKHSFFFFFFFNSSNFISIVNRDEVSENALVFEQFPLHFIFIHIFDGDPIKNTC